MFKVNKDTISTLMIEPLAPLLLTLNNISHLFLVFLLWTVSMYLFAENQETQNIISPEKYQKSHHKVYIKRLNKIGKLNKIKQKAC